MVAHGKPISLGGDSHLPRESTEGSGHIRCRCRPETRGDLARAFAIRKIGSSPELLNLSSPPSILQGPTAAVGNVGNNTQHAIPNVLHGKLISLPLCTILTRIGSVGTADSFAAPIISIGPETDAAMDRFRFNDSVVTRLRSMMQETRSSRWEEVLRVEWGWTFEQAVTVARALRSDLTGHSEVNFHTYLCGLANALFSPVQYRQTNPGFCL